MDLRIGGSTVRVVGWLAVLASAAYFLSDVIEVAQGGFGTGQLWLTLAAEAAVPVFVVGLVMARWPQLGRVGLAGGLVYAYSFVYFTGTVVYALVNDTEDFDELNDQLGAWMTVHGALMLLGGVALGYAVVRTRAYPAWTGLALMVGVVLVVVGLPDPAGLLAAGVRDVAFLGMGASLLRSGVPAGQTSRVG
jgi:hypothetical protein